MDRILTIDGREVGFRANALTPRLYSQKNGRDHIRDMNQLRKSFDKAIRAADLSRPGAGSSPEELEKYEQALNDAQLDVLDLEIFENAAFVMARQYDPSIPNSPDEWLEQFGVFSIYEILPELLELWNLNQATTSTPKKK